VIPIFLLILLGILEYTRFLFTVELLNNAAREGARYAVVNTTAVTTSDIQTYVDGYLAGQGAAQLVNYNPSTAISVYKADPATGGVLNSTWQDAGWGEGIGVSVTGTYYPMLPGLLQLTGSMTIKGTCVMTSEAN
jgi:Flp pilus assembly protein TadG